MFWAVVPLLLIFSFLTAKYYTWQKAVKEGKKKASKSLRMVAVEPSRMNVELLLEFQAFG